MAEASLLDQMNPVSGGRGTASSPEASPEAAASPVLEDHVPANFDETGIEIPFPYRTLICKQPLRTVAGPSAQEAKV